MRKAPLSWLQGFLLASAALIGGAVIVSGLAVGWFFEHHILAHEEENAVSVVQIQARQHLIPADFDLPRWSGTRKVFETFTQELPGISGIKVYDGTGRMVWSDGQRLVQEAFPGDPRLASALGGKVATALKGSVAEAYVPVTLPHVSGVVGVIRTYRDVTPIVREIRRTQWLIWGTAGAMGLFLYGALALIVSNASTKEQRAMNGIREAHEQLAAIIAGIADRMVIVDRQMRVRWMNAVAAEACGVDEHTHGLACFQILGAEPEVCQSCPAVRTFHSGKVERGMRVQRFPDGEVRYLDLVTAPLRDAFGRVQQVLEVARDISHRVELEERLKQFAQELQLANEALRDAQARLVEKERLAAAGQVVVGLHHEILNPLTGILGALQVLKHDGIAQHDKALALGEAEAEIRKIEQFIRRLTTLRRAAGTPYVGETTMLDLDRSCAEEERT